MTTIEIPTPSGFRFAPTAISHGWCELPPFAFDDQRASLERIQRLRDGIIVKVQITSATHKSLKVGVSGLGSRPTKHQKEEVFSLVKRCLNFDQDLTNFYKIVRGHARYNWVARVGAGRLLVSPSVWEDLAKTLLTTNTTWNVTVQMCRRLSMLGDEYSKGGNCFPTPDQVARLSVDKLTERVRAGYRTAYLHELARKIVNGEFDVELLRNSELTSDEVFDRLKSIKGFGDYAAGSMLKLLGRFDRLGIDTGCRDVFRAQIKGGAIKSDDEIRAYYQPFGRWQGLVMWMDVMKVNLLGNLKRLPS